MTIDPLDSLFHSRFAARVQPYETYLRFLREYRRVRNGAPAPTAEEGHRIFRDVCRRLTDGFLPLIGEEPPTLAEVRLAFTKCARWRERGFRLLLPGDSGWPRVAGEISDPPRGLFVWGDVGILATDLLAVVGSRAPSAPTTSWLESELADFLKLNPDVNLISGGARGVDQCAHRAALRRGRPTVVFLPCGFQKFYPPELERWSDAILAAGGCFISEYAPDVAMWKSYFGERNRLISAFSRGVLIVEARRRSGTLLTARAAADQARAVFVVPGPPFDPQFAGSLDLLAEGATMVRDAQELSVFVRGEISFSYCGLKASSTSSESLSTQP